MNLFRSEEHVRKWSGFKTGTDEGIVELSALVKVFSGNLFTRRLDPDYISNFQRYIGEFVSAIGEIAKVRPFWSPKAP
jgi:hypothetical protein